MSSVTFSALSKKFDDFTAVDDLDLQIQDGEFCIFVGPSGCGKTTALRMLSGLEQPTGGSIHLGAHDITATPAKERNIAMVFQSYALYPHMTVAENMGFALRMQGAPKPEIRERVGNAATLLDIETLLDRYPRQLSGGQRQRVAVGRAIVRDPEVFLFDEPLSNLDAKLRNTARTELRDLQRRLGTTTVYVTHDQVEAMTMADRIVIMNKGRAEQIGPPLRVYDDPETAFVAGFLGSPSMNLIPLAEILRSVATQSDSPLATFLERFVTRDQDQLLLGFRPEHVILSHANDLPGIKLPVRIVQIEHLGAEAVIILDLQGCRLTARINERRMPKLGDTVTATIALDDLLLFEETSGRRIRPSARSVTPPRHTLAAS